MEAFDEERQWSEREETEEFEEKLWREERECW
ncbi:pyruvate dehydrogenase [Enterococcus faecalis]|nr:pyruvate dehydrogenase [Enterococcus faecalis]